MKFSSAVFAVLALLAPAAFAQINDPANPFPQPAFPAPAAAIDPQAYGTTSLSVVSVNAWEFGANADAVISADGWLYRWVSTGFSVLFAPLNVPTGVLLTGLEIEGCDYSEGFSLDALLVAVHNELGPGGILIGPPAVSSGAGGCSKWSADLSGAAHITDNDLWSYVVRVVTPGQDGSTKFINVRIYYQRLISPGPGVATFGDVPTTHPLFQFVEALAASGITAGCAGGNFCPNDPLTRGQMAVFLAKALGLHWAP